VRDTLSESCVTSNEWFQVAAEYTEPGYSLHLDECVSQSEDDRLRYLRGAELDADSFAGALLIASGEGRLRALVFTTMTGVTLMPQLFSLGISAGGSYRDQTLGVSCRPHKAADGAFRCIPSLLHENSAPSSLTYDYDEAAYSSYGDDKCASPLRTAFGEDGACAPPFSFLLGADDAVSAVYELRAPAQLTTTYRLEEGKCVESGEGRFRGANKVPFETLAEIKRQP
jgi:hypothetical protein